VGGHPVRSPDSVAAGPNHFPEEYQGPSEAQRRALLAGLLDTDGTVTQSGCVQFSVTDERLFFDVRELVVGLGYRCGVSTKSVAGRNPQRSIAYTLTVSTDDVVFGLYRKAALHKERRAGRESRADSRFIVDVRRVDSVPVRCVEVDNGAHMYLAGRSMI